MNPRVVCAYSILLVSYISAWHFVFGVWEHFIIYFLSCKDASVSHYPILTSLSITYKPYSPSQRDANICEQLWGMKHYRKTVAGWNKHHSCIHLSDFSVQLSAYTLEQQFPVFSTIWDVTVLVLAQGSANAEPCGNSTPCLQEIWSEWPALSPQTDLLIHRLLGNLLFLSVALPSIKTKLHTFGCQHILFWFAPC